jgi:hypothetical protein
VPNKGKFGFNCQHMEISLFSEKSLYFVLKPSLLCFGE